MSDAPQSQLILYRTPDGQTRIQCRFENENVWLTQALMAELFQKDVRTINEHLMNIFQEGELSREATIRKFRIVRQEGVREVAREVEHYNLEAIIPTPTGLHQTNDARRCNPFRVDEIYGTVTQGSLADSAPLGGRTESRWNSAARDFEQTIARNVAEILEA